MFRDGVKGDPTYEKYPFQSVFVILQRGVLLRGRTLAFALTVVRRFASACIVMYAYITYVYTYIYIYGILHTHTHSHGSYCALRNIEVVSSRQLWHTPAPLHNGGMPVLYVFRSWPCVFERLHNP